MGKQCPGHRGPNRDYDCEYNNKDLEYRQGDPKNIKDRNSRNKAHAEAEKELGRPLGARGTSKEEHVHHVDGNPRNNSKGNTKVVSAKKNRQEGNPSDPSGLVELRNSVARKYGRR